MRQIHKKCVRCGVDNFVIPENDDKYLDEFMVTGLCPSCLDVVWESIGEAIH